MTKWFDRLRIESPGRRKLRRYVATLEQFCGLQMLDRIECDGYEFDREYRELKKAGFVFGDIARRIIPDTKEMMPAAISDAGITALGAARLVEIKDYLWRTSIIGLAFSGIGRLFWLAVGIALGVYFKTGGG